MDIEPMQVKRLIEDLGAWDGDAEIEFYLGRGDGPYEIASIYSEDLKFIDGRPAPTASKLVTIDLEKPGQEPEDPNEFDGTA